MNNKFVNNGNDGDLNLACKSGPREARAAAGRWSELQPDDYHNFH